MESEGLLSLAVVAAAGRISCQEWKQHEGISRRNNKRGNKHQNEYKDRFPSISGGQFLCGNFILSEAEQPLRQHIISVLAARSSL